MLPGVKQPGTIGEQPCYRPGRAANLREQRALGVGVSCYLPWCLHEAAPPLAPGYDFTGAACPSAAPSDSRMRRTVAGLRVLVSRAVHLCRGSIWPAGPATPPRSGPASRTTLAAAAQDPNRASTGCRPSREVAGLRECVPGSAWERYMPLREYSTGSIFPDEHMLRKMAHGAVRHAEQHTGKERVHGLQPDHYRPRRL
jgi:hypothetical protein